MPSDGSIQPETRVTPTFPMPKYAPRRVSYSTTPIEVISARRFMELLSTRVDVHCIGFTTLVKLIYPTGAMSAISARIPPSAL